MHTVDRLSFRKIFMYEFYIVFDLNEYGGTTVRPNNILKQNISVCILVCKLLNSNLCVVRIMFNYLGWITLTFADLSLGRFTLLKLIVVGTFSKIFLFISRILSRLYISKNGVLFRLSNIFFCSYVLWKYQLSLLLYYSRYFRYVQLK